MGYFILDVVLFIPGLLVLFLGKVPLTRRRLVQGSAARLIGAVLMFPLPLYLVACRRAGVPPLGGEELILDPFMPVTAGYVHLVAVGAALASLLVATVLACVTSETRRREFHPPPAPPRAAEQPPPPQASLPPDQRPGERSLG